MDDEWDEGSTGQSVSAGRGFSSFGNDERPAGRSDGEFRGRGGGGGFRGRQDEDGGGGFGGFRGKKDDGGSGFGGGFRGNDGSGGGFRGRGNDEDGGGFRGGRGGRGGFNRENGDGGGGFRSRGGGGDDENGEGGGFGGGRGRGGGRGGRGGGRRFGDENGDGDNEGGFGGRRRGGDGDGDGYGEGEPEKPREIYIPPEIPNDEESLFKSGIESGINFDKFNDIKVQVSGENAPRAINNFRESGLRPFVLDNVKKAKYSKMTPVQRYAIPIISAGRDLMACAQTGSGKTAAYLLPIISKILNEGWEKVMDGQHIEPQCIIVLPTRELATQVYSVFLKFSHGSICKGGLAYGGTAVIEQSRKIMMGCHVLVATPGRLLDFVNRGRITFASVKFVVLDEADLMLHMGFMPDMEKMFNHETMVPTGERQTLMFSATFPEEIQLLAHKFLHDFLFLAVGTVGGANSDVVQNFLQVEGNRKRTELENVLNEGELERTLVFVETKRTADFLAAFLSSKGFPTTSLHGDRLQRERETALADFIRGNMKILVATAVAGRGLDIKGVSHVINYDLPTDIDQYVHRIGRTGRVGNRGKATSFYNPEKDSQLAGNLVVILKQAGQEIPDFLQDSSGGSYTGAAFGGSDIRNTQTTTTVLEDDAEVW